MMKKILFACDLDNTLIHSKRYKAEGDVCIEWIDGKEQGYMSPRAIELLDELRETVELLPITTRSIEQYKRIVWPAGYAPSYAITTNGAVLLAPDEPEAAWRSYAEELVSPVRSALISLQERLSAQDKYIRVRMVNDFYLFAYAKDGVDIRACVAEHQGLPDIHVLASGRKLYFFPSGMDKGHALARFRPRMPASVTVAAGDSAIDLPMLERADHALVPTPFLAKQLDPARVAVCPEGEPFAEFILQYVRDIASKIS